MVTRWQGVRPSSASSPGRRRSFSQRPGRARPAVLAVNHLALVMDAERSGLRAIGEYMPQLGQLGIAVLFHRVWRRCSDRAGRRVRTRSRRSARGSPTACARGLAKTPPKPSGGATAVHGRGHVRRELRRLPKLSLDLTADLMDEPDPARLPLRLDRGGDGVEKGGARSASWAAASISFLVRDDAPNHASRKEDRRKHTLSNDDQPNRCGQSVAQWLQVAHFPAPGKKI